MGYVTRHGYGYTFKSIVNMSVHYKTNFVRQKIENVIFFFQIPLPVITNEIDGTVNKSFHKLIMRNVKLETT